MLCFFFFVDFVCEIDFVLRSYFSFISEFLTILTRSDKIKVGVSDRCFSDSKNCSSRFKKCVDGFVKFHELEEIVQKPDCGGYFSVKLKRISEV